MIVYTEKSPRNYEKATRTNYFSKVAGYVSNTEKLTIFLYASNDWKLTFECEHLHEHQKVKYLGINLTKCVQNLYTVN